MEHRPTAGAGSSASAISECCPTVEEMQPLVAETSDSSVSASALEDSLSAEVTTTSHQQNWTQIDYTSENEDDYAFVREFPGRQDIRKIKREHIKFQGQIDKGGQGTIHLAEVSTYNRVSDKYEPDDDCYIAKVFRGRNCGQWPEELFGLHAYDVHVCQFHGYCIDGDTFILLMQKYDCSLRQALDRQMKKWKTFFGGRPVLDTCALYLIIEIALGMRFLHENNILHRDLKADNIFVTLDLNGIPTMSVIGDFDVASNVVGTLFWRAPEYCKP